MDYKTCRSQIARAIYNFAISIFSHHHTQEIGVIYKLVHAVYFLLHSLSFAQKRALESTSVCHRIVGWTVKWSPPIASQDAGATAVGVVGACVRQFSITNSYITKRRASMNTCLLYCAFQLSHRRPHGTIVCYYLPIHLKWKEESHQSILCDACY